MKKPVKIIVALAVAAAAGFGGYYVYTNFISKPADLNTKYSYATATRGEVSQTVTATGYVEASDIAELYIDMAQSVKSVKVKVGDAVIAGQLLVEYDVIDDVEVLNRKLQEAELNLANAILNQQMIGVPVSGNELLQYQSDITTANKNISDAENDLKSIVVKITQQQLKLDDAKTTLNRTKVLSNESVVSQQNLEQVQLAYDNAVVAMDDLLAQKAARQDTLSVRHEQKVLSEEKLANAQNKLSDESTRIKSQLQANIAKLNELEIENIKADLAKYSETTISPINGYITEVNVVEGATASKNTAIIKICDTSKIIVKSDVSEYDAPLLELSQTSKISTSGLPDVVFTGNITKIAVGAVKKENSADDEVVVPIEVTVNNPDAKLKVGYTVDLEVYIQKHENVISLPIQAIGVEEDSKYVYILRDNELVKTTVTTGLYGNKTEEILSGVEDGDKVVLNPSGVNVK